MKRFKLQSFSQLLQRIVTSEVSATVLMRLNVSSFHGYSVMKTEAMAREMNRQVLPPKIFPTLVLLVRAMDAQ